MNTLQRLSNMICDVTAVSLAGCIISEFEELRSTKGFKVSQTSDRQTWSFVRQRIIPLQLSCFYKDWLVPWSPLCFVFLELFPVQNKMAVMSLITFYRSRNVCIWTLKWMKVLLKKTDVNCQSHTDTCFWCIDHIESRSRRKICSIHLSFNFSHVYQHWNIWD